MASLSRHAGTYPPWALAALGVTQIIGYGTLFYSFATLAPDMSRDLGWNEEWIFTALTVALVAGGLAAPYAGRLADRHGAANVMSLGSIAAALALAGCAMASGPLTFVAGLVTMELASAFVLYAAAFVAIVQGSGGEARGRITHLTLIAGFASTIFWPLTGWLASFLDWRDVYLVFAALNLLLCLPLHLAIRNIRPGGNGRTPSGDTPGRAEPLEPALVPPAERPRRLRFLLLAMAVEGFVLGSILVHMIPLTRHLGLGADAAWLVSLFGPAQVASRLVNMVFGSSLRQATLAAIAAALPVAGLVLLLMTGTLAGAAGFAILFGMGSGLISIIAGTVPLELFGREGYGRAVGLLSAARQLATAVAPALLALMIARLEAVPALWIVTVAAGLGFLLFALLAVSVQPRKEAGASSGSAPL